ncbi:hypothetical protein PAHAL_5G454000 [Panicum hallii]|uniref:Uncharacterized protein n=1 Tax=Panicum hallii TaxID=206008 RepID=A0A2T8INF7_9POAL|nr:hypothetical protein PAHAL_5G454000 [Panicum hallii]
MSKSSFSKQSFSTANIQALRDPSPYKQLSIYETLNDMQSSTTQCIDPDRQTQQSPTYARSQEC